MKSKKTTAAVAAAGNGRVAARELSQIKREVDAELHAGHVATEKTAEPFRIRVGKLLLEAREQCIINFGRNKGLAAWRDWVCTIQNPATGAPLLTSSAERWVAAAGLRLTNKADAQKTDRALTDSRDPNHAKHHKEAHRGWGYGREFLGDSLQGASKEDRKARVKAFQEEQKQERARKDADRKDVERESRLRLKLATEIVDSGYRVLATQLHPDKAGGSHEAFARLADVAKHLRSLVKESF